MMWTRPALLSVLTIGLTVVLSACGGPTVTTRTPPPGHKPVGQQVYSYDHRIQSGSRDILAKNKPVVALLRTGDFVDFPDAFPFGARTRIVVVPEAVSDRAVIVNWDAPVIQAPESRQFLTQELVTCGCFTVVDRERVVELLREQAFAASQPDAAVRPPRKGRMLGVQYVLEAACFPPGSPPAVDSSWAQLDRLLSPNERPMQNIWAVYINAYDTETGQVKAVGFGGDRSQLMACRRAVSDMIRQLAKDYSHDAESNGQCNPAK